MDCPFCCFLRNYIGQFIRIGVVCNCDTNDHIYWDGFITRFSFCDNLIKLFDCPIDGRVIFTGCCDDIFEIYLFANDTLGSAATPDPGKMISIAEMVNQRRMVLKSVQGNLQKEETAHE